MFFPEVNESHKSNEAIMNYCFGCTVRKDCEAYRIKTDTKHGVWGGKLITRNDKDSQ